MRSNEVRRFQGRSGLPAEPVRAYEKMLPHSNFQVKKRRMYLCTSYVRARTKYKIRSYSRLTRAYITEGKPKRKLKNIGNVKKNREKKKVNAC